MKKIILSLFVLLVAVGRTFAFGWTTTPSSSVSLNTSVSAAASGQANAGFALTYLAIWVQSPSGTWYISGVGTGANGATINASGSKILDAAGTWNWTVRLQTSSPSGSPSGSQIASTSTTVGPTATTFSFSNLTYTYDGSAHSATATPSPSGASYTSDLTKGPGAGSYTVSATATGGYSGSGSATLTINKANQAAISLSAATTSQAYGSSQTISVSGGSGTGAIGPYIAGQSSAGNATLVGTTLTANASSGWVDLQGTRDADSNYNAEYATPVRVNFTQASTTFSFSNLSYTFDGSAKTAAVTPSPAGATYSSDLTKGPGAGNYTVSATANGNYSGSGSATLAIGKAPQQITFTNPGTQTYGTPLNLSATASTGLTVSFAVTSGPATLSGTTLSFTGVGSVTVTASQGGNSNYNAASDVAQTFSVSPQAATFALNVSSFTYNGAAQGPSIVPTPGAATFTSGGTLSATNAGSYTATATANGNYTGSNSSLGWSINKANQTITFANPGTQTYGTPLNLGATATSGLTVSFTVTSGPATLSGTTLTFTGAGSVTVTASQAGNGNYNAATNVAQTFTVNKATPTGTFAGRTRIAGSTNTYTVVASDLDAIFAGPGGAATPTGTVTYSIVGPGTAVVASTVLTSATYTIRASYPGDGNYNATTKDATWTITPDGDGDGITDVIETSLGTSPTTANATDTGAATALKVHQPN